MKDRVHSMSEVACFASSSRLQSVLGVVSESSALPCLLCSDSEPTLCTVVCPNKQVSGSPLVVLEGGALPVASLPMAGAVCCLDAPCYNDALLGKNSAVILASLWEHADFSKARLTAKPCRLKPWLRRAITRGIAIIPAAIVTAVMGNAGAARLLVLSQVHALLSPASPRK